MKKTIFYYDESFHDRKIKEKNGNVNIFLENSSDIYVGVFIGINSFNHGKFIHEFKQFEINEKLNFGLSSTQELKATMIKKKNFKHGIASFNETSLNFYESFFSLFGDDIILHMSLLSKVSLLISTILENLKLPEEVNRNSFQYSLTKFIHNYGCYDLLVKLFKTGSEANTNDFVNRLKKYLSGIIIAGENAKRKEIEIDTLSKVLFILENSQVDINMSKEYLWNYDDIFSGFKLLINEREIDEMNLELIIDNDDLTFHAGRTILYDSTIYNRDSKEEYGIRACDILSNFIGRMIFSLDKEMDEGKLKTIKNIQEYDFESRKLLPLKWFDLNEKQFSLYKKINNIINHYNNYYWTTYSSLYFDYINLFFSLIRYISSYESLEEFSNVTLVEHSEYYNTQCVLNMKERFEML